MYASGLTLDQMDCGSCCLLMLLSHISFILFHGDEITRSHLTRFVLFLAHSLMVGSRLSNKHIPAFNKLLLALLLWMQLPIFTLYMTITTDSAQEGPLVLLESSGALAFC